MKFKWNEISKSLDQKKLQYLTNHCQSFANNVKLELAVAPQSWLEHPYKEMKVFRIFQGHGVSTKLLIPENLTIGAFLFPLLK